MDLPTLLTGLLRILLWQAACAGAEETSAWQLLSPPELSWSPPGSVVSRGEPIHLNCSPPGGQEAKWFFFHQLKEGGKWTELVQRQQNHFVVPTLHLKAKETFACSYLGRNRKGRRWHSEKSNQAMITIS
ncbi:leukocyte immunoglobulin-like receptor subfamily B member 1, partial [Varanus komodoensis]